MNLRDLKYIVAVADLKSFVQAAEHCFVSQPTLSMQIKKLEESLNVKIFERNNKNVLITTLGEEIIATARRVLQECQHIEALAKNAQDPLAGDLTLGAFPTLAPYILPTLIPRIKKALPSLRLILIEEKTEHLITQLKAGHIDVALLAAPINDDTLIAEKLFDDEFMLAVAPSHPLANRQRIDPDDLINEPLLLLDEGHCLRDQALQFCQLSGVKEEQNLRATSLETLRQMVIAGTGITFIPKIAIKEDNSAIHYIPFKAPQPKRTICLVWRKTTSRAKLISQLKKLFIN